MNDDIRRDILAYLLVLDPSGFSDSEYKDYSKNMMGCLHRVVDYFEKYDTDVADLIKLRERMNGILQPSGMQLKMMDNLTKNTKKVLCEAINGNLVKEFLNKLDNEFNKIIRLNSYTENGTVRTSNPTSVEFYAAMDVCGIHENHQ